MAAILCNNDELELEADKLLKSIKKKKVRSKNIIKIIVYHQLFHISH